MCVRSDKITKVQKEQRRTIPAFYFQIFGTEYFDFFFPLWNVYFVFNSYIDVTQYKTQNAKIQMNGFVCYEKKMFYVGRFKVFGVPCCWWRCKGLGSLQELKVALAGAAVWGELCTCAQPNGDKLKEAQDLQGSFWGYMVLQSFKNSHLDVIPALERQWCEVHGSQSGTSW